MSAPGPIPPTGEEWELGLPVDTARLTLRRPEPTDLEDVLAIYSPPEVSRYLYLGPFDRDDARAWLERAAGFTVRGDGDGVNIVGVQRASGRVVATYMVRLTSAEHRQGEIGYVVRPGCTGQGIATEGARAMLAIGFDRWQLHRMTAQCDARNAASAAVMRRLGMREEAHLVENEWVKGEWTDERVFALLRSEWDAQRAADTG